MPKRVASIRRGIRYQDLVAAEALLDMVFDDDSPPIWVRMEDRDGVFFDDVVIGYSTEVVWKQIKWAENPVAEPLTLDLFTKSGRKRRTPFIKSIAESYAKLSASRNSFRFEFITNRMPDAEMRRLLVGSTSRIRQKRSKAQQLLLDKQWRPITGLDTTVFAAMLGTVQFRSNSPDIETREKSIRGRLRDAGCGPNSFERLLEGIYQWAQDDTKYEINREDVEKLLGLVQTTPANEFELPEPRVDRPELRDEIVRRIRENPRGYFAVLGSPGSGKSTLLNTFRETTEVRQEFELIVYNCFTGTSDTFLRTRARTDNFAQFLTRELRRAFSGRIGFPIKAGATDVENLLARAGQCSIEGRTLIIVIDGIDYAKRFAKPSDSLRDALPISLPNGIVIVVSAQVTEQLPPHLQSLDSRRVIHVPALTAPQIERLLNRHGVFTVETSNVERDEICRRAKRLSSGHALHVSYVAKQLKAGLEGGRLVDDIVKSIPRYDGHIENYYKTLFSRPQTSLAKAVLALLAASPFELNAKEIAGLLHSSPSEYDIEDVLSQFAFLFDRVGHFLYFVHDSLRAFAQAELEPAAFGTAQQIEFLINLDRDPRVGEHLLFLLAEDCGQSPFGDSINCDWLAKQIAAGANVGLLREGLSRLALHEIDQRKWSEMARCWTLLRCLYQASDELNEAAIVNGWLAIGETALVERYAFVGRQFLSTYYPGPGLTDILEHHGQNELAERLAERKATEGPPPLSMQRLPDFGFERYVRQQAARQTPSVMIDVIRKRIDEIKESGEHNVPESFIPTVEQFSEAAAYSCLEHGQFERVLDLYWLPVKRSVVDLAIESRLRLVESMAFVRLDFLRHGQKV